MLWDIYCRVVDNFGDIGVCWRTATGLAAHGDRVRLHVDDARALAWMAPAGAPGVQVLPWDDSGAFEHEPPDVVIEAFGCRLPPRIVECMAAVSRPPMWINLEYLSAEAYVERSHGLPSPQPDGAGARLAKWFFYPGFTRRTGGLLREPGLVERVGAVRPDEWLDARGLARRPGERLVSLFCYPGAPVPALVEMLAETPTLLLATAGAAAQRIGEVLGRTLARGHVRAVALPYLPQVEYDRMLAACDVNFVRGEDSFVRAQWTAKPFVWQIYPQDDGAHAAKLNAFLDLFLAGAAPTLSLELRTLWAAWNGLSSAPLAMPDEAAWRVHAERWRDGLLAQPDLVTQLRSFVMERR